VIQIKSKAKRRLKAKVKGVRKNVPRKSAQPAVDFTAEDIAEINMFGAAIAKANWEAAKDRWDETVAAYEKTKAKRRP
jgi:hypothetical protein